MKRKLTSNIPYIGAAIILKPSVFQTGDYYIAKLEQSPTAVIGSGATIEEALVAWEINLQDHLHNAELSDPIVQHITGVLVETAMTDTPIVNQEEVDAHLNTIEDPIVTEQIRRFYNQFQG